MADAVLRRDERLADLLAGADVVPGADHLRRRAMRIAEHLHLVVDPAIAAVLLAEAVLVVQATLIEEARKLLEDPRPVVGVQTVEPEIGTPEIVLALVAEEILDVPAYEGRPVVARRLEAVDHRRRGGEQVLDAA